MFCVYENNKPCSVEGFRVHSSWKTNRFNTFDEALAYAMKWLGEWDTSIPSNWNGSPLNYDFFGDLIEIREEQ